MQTTIDVESFNSYIAPEVEQTDESGHWTWAKAKDNSQWGMEKTKEGLYAGFGAMKWLAGKILEKPKSLYSHITKKSDDMVLPLHV